MADTLGITTGSDAVVSTDEVTRGGVAQHVQFVKLMDGAEGSANQIGLASDADKQLYVRPPVNKQGTLIASTSIAPSGSETSADQVNLSYRGVILYLNVTAVPTGSPGGLFLTFRGIDPVSGIGVVLNPSAPTGVTAVGAYAYELGPGATGDVAPGSAYYMQARVSGFLPYAWRVIVAAGAGGTGNYTFSVGYSLQR